MQHCSWVGSYCSLHKLPSSRLVVFAILIGSALLMRGDSATHKRLMLLGTAALMLPALALMVLLVAATLIVSATPTWIEFVRWVKTAHLESTSRMLEFKSNAGI